MLDKRRYEWRDGVNADVPFRIWSGDSSPFATPNPFDGQEGGPNMGFEAYTYQTSPRVWEERWHQRPIDTWMKVYKAFVPIVFRRIHTHITLVSPSGSIRQFEQVRLHNPVNLSSSRHSTLPQPRIRQLQTRQQTPYPFVRGQTMVPARGHPAVPGAFPSDIPPETAGTADISWGDHGRGQRLGGASLPKRTTRDAGTQTVGARDPSALVRAAQYVSPWLPSVGQMSTAAASLAKGSIHVLTAPNAYLHDSVSPASKPATMSPTWTSAAHALTRPVQSAFRSTAGYLWTKMPTARQAATTGRSLTCRSLATLTAPSAMVHQATAPFYKAGTASQVSYAIAPEATSACGRSTGCGATTLPTLAHGDSTAGRDTFASDLPTAAESTFYTLPCKASDPHFASTPPTAGRSTSNSLPRRVTFAPNTTAACSQMGSEAYPQPLPVSLCTAAGRSPPAHPTTYATLSCTTRPDLPAAISSDDSAMFVQAPEYQSTGTDSMRYDASTQTAKSSRVDSTGRPWTDPFRSSLKTSSETRRKRNTIWDACGTALESLGNPW